MKSVTHLEKVITGEASAVTHLERVIAQETAAVTYTEKVIAGTAPPITHLQKVIAGEASPVTHLEYVWAGGSPPPEVREYTGPVPVTITADGTPLIDYLISGNTTQNGTPTPDNPIMPQGTGERTGNLLSEKYENRSINGVGAFTIDSNYDLWFGEVVAGQTYAISNMNYVYGFFTTKPLPNTGATYDGTRGYEISGTAVVTVPSGCTWIAVRVLHNADNAMLNLGSTALPYEPYGFEISISSASTTTPIYLGEVQSTRRIKKYEFTGQESIALYNSAGLLGFQYLMGTMQNNMRTNGLCTHFIPQITGSSRTGDGVTFGANNQYLYFTFSAATISAYNLTDVESISSFLRAQYAAGTPVTVWYVLANPETGIVNEPLMRIGDYADTVSKAQAGVVIPTNNGSTTIDVDTELKPSEVYIKYMG